MTCSTENLLYAALLLAAGARQAGFDRQESGKHAISLELDTIDLSDLRTRLLALVNQVDELRSGESVDWGLDNTILGDVDGIYMRLKRRTRSS